MTPTAETRAARGLYGQVLPASHFAASSLGGGVPRPTTSAGRPSTAARLAERAKPLMERLATPRDERSYDAAALRRKAPGAPALGAGFAPDPPQHAMAYDDEAEVLHPCIDSLQAAVNECAPLLAALAAAAPASASSPDGGRASWTATPTGSGSAPGKREDEDADEDELAEACAAADALVEPCRRLAAAIRRAAAAASAAAEGAATAPSLAVPPSQLDLLDATIASAAACRRRIARSALRSMRSGEPPFQARSCRLVLLLAVSVSPPQQAALASGAAASSTNGTSDRAGAGSTPPASFSSSLSSAALLDAAAHAGRVLFSLSKRPELDPIIRQAGATEAVLDVLRSGLRPYRAAAASAPAQPSSAATSAAPAAAAASGATAGDAAADSEDEAGNALAEAQGRPAPRFEFSRCPLDVVTLTYLAGAVKNSTNDAGNATAAVAMGAVPLLCAVIRAGARRVRVRARLPGAEPRHSAASSVAGTGSCSPPASPSSVNTASTLAAADATAPSAAPSGASAAAALTPRRVAGLMTQCVLALRNLALDRRHVAELRDCGAVDSVLALFPSLRRHSELASATARLLAKLTLSESARRRFALRPVLLQRLLSLASVHCPPLPPDAAAAAAGPGRSGGGGGGGSGGGIGVSSATQRPETTTATHASAATSAPVALHPTEGATDADARLRAASRLSAPLLRRPSRGPGVPAAGSAGLRAAAAPGPTASPAGVAGGSQLESDGGGSGGSGGSGGGKDDEDEAEEAEADVSDGAADGGAGGDEAEDGDGLGAAAGRDRPLASTGGSIGRHRRSSRQRDDDSDGGASGDGAGDGDGDNEEDEEDSDDADGDDSSGYSGSAGRARAGGRRAPRSAAASTVGGISALPGRRRRRSSLQVVAPSVPDGSPEKPGPDEVLGSSSSSGGGAAGSRGAVPAESRSRVPSAGSGLGAGGAASRAGSRSGSAVVGRASAGGPVAVASAAAAAPLLTRLFFALGNLTASNDRNRQRLAHRLGAVDVLMRTLAVYVWQLRRARDAGRAGEAADARDVLVKGLRFAGNLAVNPQVAALLGAAPGIAAVGEVLMAARAAADSEMMLNAVAALGNVAFASMGAEAPAGAAAGAAAGASDGANDGAGPSAEPAVISTAARCVQRLLPLLLMQSSTEAQLEAVRAVANLGRHAGLRAQMVGAGVPAAVLELLAEQLGRGLRCIAAAELDGGGGTEPAADLPEHVGGLVYTAAGALVNLVADPAGRAQVRATVTMSASLAAAGGDQAGPDVMVRAADWSYWDIGRGDICEVLLQGLFNVVLGWEEGGPPRLTAGQAADLASFLQGVEEEEDARLTAGPEEGLPPQSPSLRALAARVAATVRAMIDADAVDASDD